MNLPKRVQQQLEAAEAAEAAYIKERAEQAAQAAPTIQAPEPIADPQVAQPPVSQPAVPAPAPEPPKVDWEHKFKVLEGMYRADVTRTKEGMRELSAQFEAMKAAAAAPAAPAQPDQKDIETFGADLIAMVQRYAEGQQAKINERLDALEQKVGVVAKQTTVTREQAFFAQLTQAVPQWQAINEDPRWHEWLQQTDPLFGLPRQEALNEARGSLHAERVVSIFKAFVASLPPPPAPPKGLEEQVTPSGAGTPAPVTPAAPQFISSAAIEAFYRDVGQGRYRGREEEMQRKEAAINLAVAQGRVR